MVSIHNLDCAILSRYLQLWLLILYTFLFSYSCTAKLLSEIYLTKRKSYINITERNVGLPLCNLVFLHSLKRGLHDSYALYIIKKGNTRKILFPSSLYSSVKEIVQFPFKLQLLFETFLTAVYLM